MSVDARENFVGNPSKPTLSGDDVNLSKCWFSTNQMLSADLPLVCDRGNN